jgi:hypothetical protein
MTGLARAGGTSAAAPDRQVALVDLLDRLLAKGVVVAGDVTLTIADVDLVHVSLRALITAVRVPDSAEASEEGST